MKLHINLIFFFSTCVGLARSLDDNAKLNALKALDMLRTAQIEIHTEKQAVASLALRLNSESAAAHNESVQKEVATAFENMAGSILNVTTRIGMDKVVKRQTDEISIPAIYNELTDIIQAIVADVVGSIVTLTNLFNDSHFIQDISGLLIQALLSLINALGHTLRALPGADKFLTFVIQILHAIPI